MKSLEFYKTKTKNALEEVSSSNTGGKEDPDFKEELKKFVKINLKIYKEKNQMIDFFGRNNISIIKTPEEKIHLIFFDPHHTYSLNSEKFEEKKYFENGKKRLLELERVTSSIQ